jgi:hypothetical protein
MLRWLKVFNEGLTKLKTKLTSKSKVTNSYQLGNLRRCLFEDLLRQNK